MRRVASWLTGLLALAIAVSALAYWFTPQIAPVLLATYLESSNVSDLRLEMQRPGLSSLRINSLSLTYGEYSVDASVIDLHYSFAGMLTGRVSAIGARALTIASRQRPDSTFGGLPVPPSELWRLIPADRVDVDSLSLEGLPVPVSGTFTMDGSGAAADVAVSRYHADLRLGRNGTFAARIADTAGSRVEATGTLSSDNQVQATLESTLNVRSLTPWLDLGETAGTLAATVDLRASANHPADLAAKGTFRLAARNEELSIAVQTTGQALVEDGRLLMDFRPGSESAAMWHGDPWRVAGQITTDLLDPARAVFIEMHLAGQLLDTPATVAVQANIDPHAAVATATATVEPDTVVPLHAELDGRIDLTTFAMDFGGVLHVADNRMALSGRYDDRNETVSANLHRRFEVDQPFRYRIGGSVRQQIEAAGDLTVDLSGGRDSDSAYRIETRAHLGDGHVRVGNVSAHGVSINGTLRSESNQPLVGDVTLAADAINTGLSIHSVVAAAALLRTAPLRVQVSSVEGQALGGTFSAEDFGFDAEDGGVFELRLNGLDVTQVLELQRTALTGTGTLDGLVPMTVRGRQATVSGGGVQARPPGGSLQYPGAGTLSLDDPTRLDVALRVLEDFRYDALTASVDYHANGTLVLGVRLEGSNPNVQQGRLVHFNANVEQHLPTLLRSLQVASTLDIRVRQHFEASSP